MSMKKRLLNNFTRHYSYKANSFQNTPLKFKIWSDIHLENDKQIKRFFEYRSLIKVPYLCLLGDIGNPRTKIYENFLRLQAYEHDHVLLLSGNHEYHSTKIDRITMQETDDIINEICYKIGNITYMDNKTVELDGYKFIGSTLWGNIPKRYMDNVSKSYDFRSTLYDENRMFSPKIMNVLNKNSTNFITKELEDSNRK